MKKAILFSALGLVALIVMALILGRIFAGSKDENYYGEEGEQPAVGSPADSGEPKDAPDTGDRTRFKD